MRDLPWFYRVLTKDGQPLFFSGLLLAAGLAAGCSSVSDAAAGAKPAGPVLTASSDVRRLAAWQDAEFIAAQAADRTPAAGRGQSMAPIFGDNTMIVLAQIAYEDLQSGMMVAYRNREGFRVIHRLVERVARDEWRVQGINNPSEDRERVTRDNYLGVVYASLVHE